MPRTPYDYCPGTVIFNEAAALSIQGQFPDSAEPDEVWNDDQARDYIKSSRPDLFMSLNQLSIASSHVAEPVELGFVHLTPAESALMLQSAVIATRNKYPLSEDDRFNNSQKRQMKMYRNRTMELQHKRNVESHVLGGRPLVLRKLQKPGNLLMCSAPTCQHAIGQGAYFITLLGDHEIHYGLECLENLFAEKKRAVRRAKAFFNYHALDGAAFDELVMPHNLPSNSVDNRQLRKLKQDEIDEITEEDVQHQQQQRQSALTVITEDRNLHLQRPLGLEALEERYKKQGLTRYDREGARKSPQDITDQPKLLDNELHPADDGLPLICYCREPEGGLDLIKCNSEYCLIGWFHIDCCNEDGRVLSDEEFCCGFCAELIRNAPEVDTFDADNVTESHAEDATALSDGNVPDLYADYKDEAVVEGNGVENYDTPVDESPRTPSPSPTVDYSHMSSPYTGSPTGFVTINPRPAASPNSPLSIGLDGMFDSKRKAIPKFHTAASAGQAFFIACTSFEDLAPFITYKTTPHSLTGLQDQEILIFEGWRNCMPDSKLLAKSRLNANVTNDELPYGPRLDIRTLAEQWIDKTVRKGGRHVFKSLCKWFNQYHATS